MVATVKRVHLPLLSFSTGILGFGYYPSTSQHHMDKEKGSDSSESNNNKAPISSQDDAEALLRKCLEESKGDSGKCKSKINAFQFNSASSSTDPRKPLPPLRLRSGLLTDV